MAGISSGSLRSFQNQGNGTFSLTSSYALGFTPYALAIGDFNGDGVPDAFAGGGGAGSVRLAETATTTSIQRLNIASQAGAYEAQEIIEQALQRVRAERSSLGAAQSRLEAAHQVLQSSRELTTQASSRIQDADIAVETAELIKFQVLQQTVKQARQITNIQGEIVLRLLGGSRE